MRWKRVSKQEPCVICKHPDWCQRGERVAQCMRIESDRPTKDGGWLHPLDAKLIDAEHQKPEAKPAKSDSDYAAIWEPRAKRWFANQIDSIARLAAILGVSKDALDMLRVGYDEHDKFWTFPERNERGQVVGITRRFENGQKLCAVGSKRGLTFVDDWQDWPGSCYVVEGASDVAAMLTMGLCAIGRPSNVGGVEYLTKLIRGFERPIIVMGERDKKNHDDLAPQMQTGHNDECIGCHRCWPGLYGAERTTEALRKELKQNVSFSFPPDGAKDPRAWLQVHAGISSELLGKQFVDSM